MAWDQARGDAVSAGRSYDLIDGLPPGHKEQHPSVWITALNECLDELRAKGVDMAAVAGIGVSGQQHGLVALDSSHQPVRASKLWCDTSTEPQCRRIMEAAGGQPAYQAEIGNALPPGFTASKILWMKENEPETYRKVRYLLLPHDYLNLYLTGNLVAEPGDASGTGYFRVREREWSKAALSWIDPDRDLMECIPKMIASREPAGQLRGDLQRKWGMSGRVVVSSGGGDNMMGAIGSGNVKPGTVTVSLGTSGTLYSFSASPIIDAAGEIAAFCDSTGGWLPLVCTMNVTVATEMIRAGFLGTGLDEFNQAVEGVRPGADGLILVPYLEGERMPNVPNGTGVLLGLRPATATPGHLARAAMEGVTFGLFYGMERMQELGIVPSEIRLIGGGAKSRVWRQISADVFDRPVVCPENQEGPAFGAALQALWCASGQDAGTLIEQNLKLDDSTRQCPIAANRSVYKELYGLYKEFSRDLIGCGVFEKHRALIVK
ncbi:MAG: xylulokinase [Acidobacteria bacterium]|nr:MAG: xylulokinase [Acidobacteriota bacterium]